MSKPIRAALLAAVLVPAPLALALPVLLVSMAPTAAQAHAILVGSDPATGATVPPGPTGLHLHYNSRIDATRSRLTLTGPDGNRAVLAILPGAPPDRLEARATLRAGTNTLRWQVLAVDGHITRGDIRFTVAGAPPTP